MKKTAFLFMIIAAISCHPDYEGEKRLVFETRLTDYNNNPIGGEYINIHIFQDFSIGQGANDDVIADGFTDVNGYLRLIFPAPLYHNSSKITINYSGNTAFQEKHVSQISIYDFQDYKLNLSATKLYRNDELTRLNIIRNHTTSDDIQLGLVTVDGQGSGEYFNFLTQVDESKDHSPFIQKFVKNQNLTITYDVIDFSVTPAAVTHHSEIIPAGNDAITNYTITY